MHHILGILIAMINEASFPEQSLIDCLKMNYSIEVATLTHLPLGADMDASIYKAQAHDKSSYFIKLKHGHHNDISTLIITLLREAGIQQVIPPVRTIHGQFTQRLNNFTLSVFPFMEGQDGFHRNLTRDQWVTLGKVMRQVHEMNVPSSMQVMIRRESFSPKWRQTVRSLYSVIESNPKGDEITAKLLIFMKEHAATIHRLVDRAEQLAQNVQDPSSEFVLCHSDIHGGNVLIDGNGVFYIVDWDHPIMAPPERDLMFMGGGIGNVWNKPHEEEWFYEGYGSRAVNTMLLSYYRHERIVEDIAVYCQELLFPTEERQDRVTLYEQFLSQFDPQGVVEIAFKTD